MEKLEPSLENVNLFFPATPPLKTETLSSPLFWKFVKSFNPSPLSAESGVSHYNCIKNDLEM